MGARTRAQVFWFSRQKEVEHGACVRDGNIVFRDNSGQREIMQVSEIPLKGAHNLENVLAGGVCRRAHGLRARENPARLYVTLRPLNTGWSSWLQSVASTTTTIRKPPTSTRPSKHWNRFPRTST